MSVDETRSADLGVVGTMLDCIERGDMDALRACFAPDAVAWHNFDETEKKVDAVVGILGDLASISTTRAYEDRRATAVGTQVFLQHTLTATLRSGNMLRLPAMMRLELTPEGLIGRLEEYFDTRASDPVAAEPR